MLIHYETEPGAGPAPAWATRRRFCRVSGVRLTSTFYSPLFSPGGLSPTHLLCTQYFKWKQCGQWPESQDPPWAAGCHPRARCQGPVSRNWGQPPLPPLPWGSQQAGPASLASDALSGQAESVPCGLWGLCPNLVPLSLVCSLCPALWVCGGHLPCVSEPGHPSLPSFCDLWWVILDPALVAPGLACLPIL